MKMKFLSPQSRNNVIADWVRVRGRTLSLIGTPKEINNKNICCYEIVSVAICMCLYSILTHTSLLTRKKRLPFEISKNEWQALINVFQHTLMRSLLVFRSGRCWWKPNIFTWLGKISKITSSQHLSFLLWISFFFHCNTHPSSVNPL